MQVCTLDIGGARVELSAADERSRDFLRERFSGFVATSMSAPALLMPIEIDVHLEDGAPPSDGVPFHLLELPSGALVVSGHGAHADVSADNRTARLRCPWAPQPVHALVRLLVARQLLRSGALLAHASAVVSPEGRGWVFAGHSGAGKTTIAERLMGETACDEAVVVGRDDVGATLASTPYWVGRPLTARLDVLLFVERGSTRDWRPLSSARAAARLFSFAGPLPPSCKEQALDTAARIAASVPVSAAVTLATLDDIDGWLAQKLNVAHAETR